MRCSRTEHARSVGVDDHARCAALPSSPGSATRTNKSSGSAVADAIRLSAGKLQRSGEGSARLHHDHHQEEEEQEEEEQQQQQEEQQEEEGGGGCEG